LIKPTSRRALDAFVVRLALGVGTQADPVVTQRLDFATYSLVSRVLEEQGSVKKEFAKDSSASK
jgi:hypothetical protein